MCLASVRLRVGGSMSFADYLRDRISSDYKNLIIQKLEEIRQQTEQLKGKLTPSFDESQQLLRKAMQNELVRIQDLMDRELVDSQDRISADFHTLVDKHIASWYDADVSPFEQQLELLLSDIVSNVPAPAKKMSEDIESLSDLMRKLDEQNTQSEILNTLLMHIASWVDRAVLFVVKADQASGWAALGLGTDWNTDRVRAMRVDLSKQTTLSDVVNKGEMSYGGADKYADNALVYSAIGSKFPKSVAACPIKVRGKIAGILYADFDAEFDEKPDIPNLLYLATRVAGFAIDLLPLKPKVSAAAPAPAPAPPAQQVQPPPVPPPVPAPEVTAPVEPVQEKVEEEAVAEAPDAEGTVIMPAAPPAVISEEDQKLHDDAKRFARLLVSEIKLYNEAQVAAGREHRDLYERLKEDIERSRRMYQDRVPTHIHSSTNYFYEELVRTLANGDPTMLGM